MGIWGDDFGDLPEGVRSVLSGGSDLYKFIILISPITLMSPKFKLGFLSNLKPAAGERTGAEITGEPRAPLEAWKPQGQQSNMARF